MKKGYLLIALCFIASIFSCKTAKVEPTPLELLKRGEKELAKDKFLLPHDINATDADGNTVCDYDPEEIKKRLSLRKPELAGQIDEVLTKYDAYKKVLARVEELRAQRNEMSKSIGKIKKEQV